MHTTKILTPEELAAELVKITGESVSIPAPEPEGFCPGCGIASNGFCPACLDAMNESARLNSQYPFGGR